MRRILGDRQLAVILSNIDHDLAEAVRQKRCPRCDGPLHVSNFPRKPRCHSTLPAEWFVRLSFCCGEEGCRRRVTPPSVRFLRRRLYPTVVIVLVCALRHGLTASRWRTLQAALGVDRRTVMRWIRWWREDFATSAFWKGARARFVAWLPRPSLVSSLLRFFGAQSRDGIVALLRFLSPVST